LVPSGFAVHHVLNFFAVTLAEELEAIKTGYVIPGGFGAERPAQLCRSQLHSLRSLSRPLSDVKPDEEDYDDGDANRPQP